MNLTPEQFAATRKALRAYDPKGTENLSNEHLDGVALSVVLAIVTSAPDQGSGDVKKSPTEAMVKAGADVLKNWWADPLDVLARKTWDAMEFARPVPRALLVDLNGLLAGDHIKIWFDHDGWHAAGV